MRPFGFKGSCWVPTQSGQFTTMILDVRLPSQSSTAYDLRPSQSDYTTYINTLLIMNAVYDLDWTTVYDVSLFTYLLLL